MPLKKHYTIKINTKAYLKQYLTAQFGHPILIDKQTSFGMTLAVLLSREYFHHKGETFVHKGFDTFDSVIEVKLPTWWMSQAHYGTDISKENMILLNKYVEMQFDNDLVTFCQLVQLPTIKEKLEKFCHHYNIEIDVHFTYEGIKKKEWRCRQRILKQIRNGSLDLASEAATD